MTVIQAAILGLLIYFIIQPLISLLNNYRLARTTNLSILISPITPFTWLWTLLSTLSRPYLTQYHWFRAIDWTCAWHDGALLHTLYGQSFILVSPGLNVLCTSDSRTIEHVLKDWRGFVKPDNVNEILGTFGQNVDTSNGDDWVRHRKLTAPCFSERASGTVWREAESKAGELLGLWLGEGGEEEMEGGIVGEEKDLGEGVQVVQDTSMLALNVISAVAFENHQVNKVMPGHTFSLRDALLTVMSTAISPALEGVVPWLKKSRLQILLPPTVKKLLLAMGEFRLYMEETVARERERMSLNNDAKPNLISTLIKANEAEREGDKSVKVRVSDVELHGNIFIFTAGGLESTAITLSYALCLLAMHEDVQEWVAEEVREVLSDETEEYSKVFPNLKRVMAVMYETLRPYGPSPPLPRSSSTPHKPYTIPVSTNTKNSSSSPSALDSDRKTITLPGATQIMLNSWAPQTSPAYFPNPTTWSPSRWISPSGNLMHPVSGSGFHAWGSGPRVCPGMKFSQVEFTAVLARVVRGAKVGLCVGGKDGMEEGVWEREKERVMSVLGDSVAEPLLLHVREPEKLRLRVTRR